MRIGPARATDLAVRLADGHVVFIATSMTIDVNSNGEGAASRLRLEVGTASPGDTASRAIQVGDAIDVVTAPLLDFVLGPIERIVVLADSAGRDGALMFESHERPWITERTASGTTISRRGESRPVRMLVAIEASLESPLWISRDEVRIVELVDGYELTERIAWQADTARSRA
jgi:hypothetical protein